MSEATVDTGSDREDRPAPRLDDLMLAMDVVDTLRHQEKLVEKELGQEARNAALKKRLRDIYESQGLDVSDRILEEGLKSLQESRFTYERKGSDGKRRLAMLWVRRRITGAILAGVVVILALMIGNAWWQAMSSHSAAEARRIALEETLPAQLDQAAAAAAGEAATAGARQAVDNLKTLGADAIRRGDADAAKAAITRLVALRDALVRTFDLVIVQNGQSGVFRIPDVNEGARNYYLIVEAVTPDGSKLSLPVRNEETGAVETVSTWGVRVPEATFQAVRNDKEDDGIIQNRILGTKPRGALEPDYAMPVSGGMITEWQ
jgi:hypothetical protein